MRARFHPLAIPTLTSSAAVYQFKEAFLHDPWLLKAPLHLEIGCGKGQFILQSAMDHPHLHYLGIEQAAPVLYRALEKLEPHPRPNVKFVWGDADVWLEEVPLKVERLYLQFSDPWPKARHEKRRLTHPSRLERYASIVTGSLLFKTDNEPFYQYSLTQLETSPFAIVSHGILSSMDSKVPTEFETKYRKLGKPIYFIEAKR
jgi:tRNA (guanine-N7-)-methyltransferase